MKRTLLRSAGIFLCLLGFVAAKAQVSVSATAGTASGTYTTLANAFIAINNGTHQGVISITLTGNTLETASASLDSSGNTTASNYTSISIQPAAGTPVTITGAVAGPLVNLNGADNVTIDGIALAPGGATLTISNTSTAATASTIKFINDAVSNTVKNTTIRGAGVALTTGVVFFSTGLARGNDNNTLLNNDIDATASAMLGIFSSGTTATAYQQNSGNTVTNCWIRDYFNATFVPTPSTNTANFYGLYLAAGNTDWTITGNSFYQTIPRTVAINSTFFGALIAPTYTIDKHVISGNYFGGSAAGASNTIGNLQLSSSGTAYASFIGFSIQTGGTGNLVDGNIVRNITLTSSATTSPTNAGFFGYIGGYNGSSTFNNNQVADINFINNTSGGYISFQAMYMIGRVTQAGTTVTPSFTLNNNIISNVTASSLVNAEFQFYGLRLEASSNPSLTTTTTISNPTFLASGNQINSFTITTGPAAATYMRSIGVVTSNGLGSTAPLQPKSTLSNNIIRDIYVGGNLNSYAAPTVSGIQITGAANVANGDVQNVSGNVIYNLGATTTADIFNSVAGIIVNNSSYIIEKNKVYGLSNTAPGTTQIPVIFGINVRGVITTSIVRNNFISVGAGPTTNTNIFGIFHGVSSTAPLNIHFNSVYLTGIAGTRNSVAFYRGNEAMTSAITTTVDLKNNIFYNFRSGGTGKNYAIGSFGTGTWTSNYNVLFSVDPATTATWNNADNDLATYKTNSGQEANSLRTPVNFVDPANGDLHLTGASVGDVNLRGIPVTGITTDFDNQNRSSSNPYIGADEASISLPVQIANFSGVKENGRNRLSWTTSSESNNKGFELERSADGKNFSSIGFIVTKADKGNSTTGLSYGFTDENPIAGTNYYRLKQVDNDGRSNYSGVVILKGEKIFSISALYPNPAKDELTVSVSTITAEKATITILDANGKVARHLSLNFVSGENNFTIGISEMPPGAYFVRLISASGELKTSQFIKK